MNLTEDQKKFLKEDEEKGIAFKTFLNGINLDYKDYFNKHSKRKIILDFFGLLEEKRPPAIRLRYLQLTKLNEEIKLEVINKYKELFGEYADYKIIEQ